MELNFRIKTDDEKEDHDGRERKGEVMERKRRLKKTDSDITDERKEVREWRNERKEKQSHWNIS